MQPAATLGGHPPRHAWRALAEGPGPGAQAILLVSVPIFSIQILTTSPALRNSPRAEPTPARVPARNMYTGRRAREDQVAGMERHSARQLGDLLGQVEDHVLAVGVLLEDVVDPQFQAEILRVADIRRRHDPRAERARPVEGLVLGPVRFE